MVPILADESWVIDGVYRHKLGGLVLDAADQIVWLDLPIRVWLARLLRPTPRRLVRGEELWNGNRESLGSAFGDRDLLIVSALRTHRQRRRDWPASLPAVRSCGYGRPRRSRPLSRAWGIH